MMKNGKLILFVDDDGDTAYVKAVAGTKSRTFHWRQHANPEDMMKAVSAWFAKRGVKRIVTERQMDRVAVAESMVSDGLIFNDIIWALAEKAERLEKWEDFDTGCLEDIAKLGPVHVNYVERIFEKIKAAFTPMVFCELAAAENRPQAFASDPTFLTPVNDGLNRIKDAVFGNMRADRMKQIDFRNPGPEGIST